MQKYILLTAFLTHTITGIQAQNLTTVKANIENYSAGHPEEKIYIQYDKPAYAAGETIWFKAYIMKGNELSELSKTLYVDFADSAGKVLQHGVFVVQQASAAGNFTLPATYGSNLLHVHAYTRWMLNFDTTFLYNRDVRIISAKPVNKAVLIIKTVLKPAVQFFPEGGDCIAGIPTKIAFKAVYQNGLPANIKGTIVNSKNAIVDTITCMHDGMGFFYMVAEEGETYTASYTDERGISYQASLPAIKTASATIEIKQAPGQLGYTIKRSENAPANCRQLHVAAMMHQNLVYIASIDLGAAINTGGNISVGQLPSGIMQVTLFDIDWKPLAERVAFINNGNYRFETRVSFDTLAIQKREKNVLVITVPDSVTANLSVAVTDAGIGTNTGGDIISHLLLTGELKGDVYQPGYYFSNPSDSIAAHLDLVMLTNGWRRYKWDDAVTGKQPTLRYNREVDYLSLAGKLYGLTPKQITKTGPLILIVAPTWQDSAKQLLTVPLNKDGSFAQPGFTFFDTLKIFYHFAANGGFGLNHPPIAVFTMGDVTALTYLPSAGGNGDYVFFDTTGDYRRKQLVAEQARLDELLKTVTLQNVTVKARVKTNTEILDDKYSTGVFAGEDGINFAVATDSFISGATTVIDYIQHRIPTMRTYADSGKSGILWHFGEPTLYLDGTSVDAGLLLSISMHDVAFIKVIRPPFFGAPGGGAGGAIAVFTKRGDDDFSPKGPSMPYRLVAGYTNAKQFYSPDYSVPAANAGKDVRSTLYWNPYVLTNPESHVIKLAFYNNDVTTSFRVIIEGVSSDGKLTRVEKVVE